MVVVAARRYEGGAVRPALHYFEAERLCVELDRTLYVGHFEVDVADVGLWVDGVGCVCAIHVKSSSVLWEWQLGVA